MAIAIALLCPTMASAQSSPNIVLLLADDLGYSDLTCYGSDFHETPNIDALARDGIRFTSAYSACTVCSPTRASIMTGKYPARLHLTDFIAGQNRPYAKLRIPNWHKQLDAEETTIAERLKQAGYATAHVGKWHLNPNGPTAAIMSPTAQGFDRSIDKPRAARGYFIPLEQQPGNASTTTEQGYVTDFLTDHAVQTISEWKDRPFFLYFAYHTPHTPIQGKPELVAKYKSKLNRNARHHNPDYAAMVQSLDDSVGRVLASIDDAGLTDKTIVIFLSDNGGLSQKFGSPTGYTDNFPLRRGKGSAYEGGTRIPMIVRHPRSGQAGTTCDVPVCTIDLMPTILDWTGQSPQPEIDGLSIAPLLADVNSDLKRDALFWHYPHYHAGGDSPYSAIRSGQWRLIEFYEDNRLELYDLQNDIGESANRADDLPEIRDRLRNTLHAWRTSVGAQMPTANPEFNEEFAKRMAAGESDPADRGKKKKSRKR